MRNRIGGSALKVQQDAQVPLRLHILRIDRDRCLQLRNRQIGAFLIQISLGLLDVGSKTSPFVLCGLRET
jgi:hypothetical protein